ncbi:MAG TPA: hypothetical protein VIK91_23760 [Nannocystis sp.]
MAKEPEIKVRTVPMLLAPLVELSRQFFDIFRNPTAFFGSIIGSALLTGGIAALVMFGPTFEVSADDGDELDMEFMPGELVRLGQKMDPQDIPEKIIVEETVAAPAPEAPAETTKLTTDEKAQPTEPPKKEEKKKTDAKSTEKPDPNKKNAKESDKNRDSNTPYKDLPTVKDLPGDPFGDPQGWSDIAKAGDPFATEVMKVLNGMKVGIYAGEGKDAVYKFRLEVCPDGRLSAQKKQGTGDNTLDARIKNAIDSLKISVPKNVQELLKGKCQKIRYEFTWRGQGGGKGKVE